MTASPLMSSRTIARRRIGATPLGMAEQDRVAGPRVRRGRRVLASGAGPEAHEDANQHQSERRSGTCASLLRHRTFSLNEGLVSGAVAVAARRALAAPVGVVGAGRIGVVAADRLSVRAGGKAE